MVRYVSSLLLTFTLSLVSLSADAEVTGDKDIPVNSFASLTVKKDSGDKARWKIYPLPVKSVDKGNGDLYFSGIPGTTYRVDVDIINFKSEKWDSGSIEIRFLGTNPNPTPVPPGPTPTPPGPTPPGPTPVPPNPPGPIVYTGDIWVAVVEETSTRTPEIAAVLGDLPFYQGLVNSNIIKGWRAIDPNSPDAKGYDKLAELEIAKAKNAGRVVTYPVMMFVTSKGDSIYSDTLPKDTATIRNLIKTYTGK